MAFCCYTFNDFNFASLEVKIPAHVAKTRKSRTLPLLPVTCEVVKKLIKSRHPAWNVTVPVFCTEDGVMMNRWTWAGRLRRYSKILGSPVKPYDLRHTFSVFYLRNGGNAFGLQKTLGHTNMNMTRRYIHLRENDMKQIHTTSSPINSLIERKGRVRKVS